MTLGYGDLRKGLSVELDGEPYAVVDYERSKMQQRAPVMRIRFKSFKTGRVVDRSFNGYDVKLTPASVERKSAQYIYNDGGFYYFMDTVTFDQFPIAEDQVQDVLSYMVEQTVVDAIFYEDSPIAIELPIAVDLEVADAVPWLKGDTAQGGTKPVTLETGLKVQVPLFVEVGEMIKVDTRTGEYLSRV